MSSGKVETLTASQPQPTALANRTIWVASCHGKAATVSLPFRQILGLLVKPCDWVDTDSLGTFCGEVERPAAPREVVLAKARLALVEHPSALALATEATFGPHPGFPWASIHRELLAVVDGAGDRVWIEEDVSYKTNHRQQTVHSPAELSAFAAQVGVPSHLMMLKTPSGWLKGVGPEWKDLGLEYPLEAAADMRAHCNLTRRRLIRRLALTMALRLRRRCPACSEPGFGRVDLRRGLRCSLCHRPSEWVESQIYGCQTCPCREEWPRPDGRTSLDPTNCVYCNP